MVLIVKTLWTRRRIVVPGVIFAALLGIVAAFHVKPAFPPGLHSRETQAFVADSQILIDSPVSAIGDLDQGLDGPDVRATVYANLMTTTSLIKSVATVAGVPADQLSVAGPLSTNGQATSAAGYHLTVGVESGLPIITIGAQAPTKPAAIKLADAVTSGLSGYVGALAVSQAVPSARRVVIRQLGTPTVAPASFGMTPIEGVLIFLVLSGGWCMLVLFGIRARATWRAATPEALLEPERAPEPKQLPRPRRAVASRSTSTAGMSLVGPGTNAIEAGEGDETSDTDGSLRLPRIRRRTSSL